ncbi:hypothetical protein Ddye_009674 [Dipteronia dyeriana]|uniref:DDE Tnp4 domain-containing protein n=1 Tax=Dipteronia dyeriana TaxID=168575 RepID=A0AAE0CMH2_9ROSI|nr:hypothetical protein Ddye_009674 [Dipteronia dyeriana]
MGCVSRAARDICSQVLGIVPKPMALNRHHQKDKWRKASCFRRDYDNKTIEKQVNVEYRKFRDVGISFDMIDMYEKMFKGNVAVGNCVMIISSTILLEETLGDSDHDKQTVNRENKEASQGSKGKKGKLGGATKLSKQIDRLVEVVESRSTTTSMHISSLETSIPEVMEVVSTLPGAEKGWEGSAHDTRVFLSVLRDSQSNFSKPPNGKYYLVDVGYPQMKGFAGPYKGERYHLSHFHRGEQQTGHKEIFNHAHSSLRSIIERTFGV